MTASTGVDVREGADVGLGVGEGGLATNTERLRRRLGVRVRRRRRGQVELTVVVGVLEDDRDDRADGVTVDGERQAARARNGDDPATSGRRVVQDCQVRNRRVVDAVGLVVRVSRVSEGDLTMGAGRDVRGGEQRDRVGLGAVQTGHRVLTVVRRIVRGVRGGDREDRRVARRHAKGLDNCGWA